MINIEELQKRLDTIMNNILINEETLLALEEEEAE